MSVESYFQGEQISPEGVFASSASAHQYDMQYPQKDYDGEAQFIQSVVAEYNPEASSMLDIACGTGKHLEAFRKLGFSALVGVDVSQENLYVAHQRLKGTAGLACADMRSFRFGRQFDVVTCLFSSIGHMVTTEDVQRSVAAMTQHTSPGSVVIIEPWLYPHELAKTPHIRTRTIEQDTVSLHRTSVTTQSSPGVVDIRMHFTRAQLPTEADQQPRVDMFVEEHRFGLHERSLYGGLLRAAGAEYVTYVQTPDHLPLFRELVVAKMPE